MVAAYSRYYPVIYWLYSLMSNLRLILRRSYNRIVSFILEGPNPFAELERCQEDIEEQDDNMLFYLSTANQLRAERGKLQAAIKKRKKESKPEKSGLKIFNTEAFESTREPVEIAREIYSAVTAVPPKWSPQTTEHKLKELTQAYEDKAKRATGNTRLELLGEYFKCKDWVDKFSEAIRHPDGVARSRLYEILNDGLVNGRWKDLMEEAMDKVKKDYEASWKEKLMPKGTPKPAETPKVETKKAAGRDYRFRNLTEYRNSGIFLKEAAFPRPKNLPANLNKWCGDCCWSDHTTKDCPKKRSGGGQQRPQAQAGHHQAQRGHGGGSGQQGHHQPQQAAQQGQHYYAQDQQQQGQWY